MAVLARGPGHAIEAPGFAEEADRAAERHGAAWAPARIVRDGRLVIVDDTAQSIGAFKIRGATVAVAEAADEGAERITLASSGSFGMACATAARALGVGAIVYMPASAPASKQQAIESLGARVDATYATYEAAKDAARAAGEGRGTRFLDGVGSGVFRGNASLAREIVCSGIISGEPIAVVVPLGIGSLAAPTASYLASAGVRADLVTAEPLTHCKHVAALGGHATPDERPTLADGAAVAAVPPLSAAILDEVTSAAVALSEPEIAAGIRYLWRTHGIRAEGAGALATAAYLAAPELFRPYDQVWAFVTGANIEDAAFEQAVA